MREDGTVEVLQPIPRMMSLQDVEGVSDRTAEEQEDLLPADLSAYASAEPLPIPLPLGEDGRDGDVEAEEEALLSPDLDGGDDILPELGPLTGIGLEGDGEADGEIEAEVEE